MKIEDCEMKKLEEDAEQANDVEGGLKTVDGVQATELQESLDALVSEMAGAINNLAADIIKEKLEKAMAKIIAANPSAAAAGAAAAVAAATADGSQPDADADSNADADGASADSQPEVTGKNVYIEDGREFDLCNEKDSFLAVPENLGRSKGVTPATGIALFKIKYACDLNFALVFDEYLAQCISKELCDNKVIKGIRAEYLNIIKALDSDEYKLLPTDSLSEIKFKVEHIREVVQPWTAKDNLGGIEDAAIDMTHGNLNKIAAK